MHCASLDFETYSESGYMFDGVKFVAISSGQKKGLDFVGSRAYAEHPSTEVLSCAYDLFDGLGPRLWIPELPSPEDMFNFLANGGYLKGWNVKFEYSIWNFVCAKKLGWPELRLDQIVDTMAKAQAFALPGKLKNAAISINAKNLKTEAGKNLIRKFCIPRTPTKKDPRLRLTPADDPISGAAFYDYNIRDIQAENEIDQRIPDLSPLERKIWLTAERINTRGAYIDSEGLRNCEVILEQAEKKYTERLKEITDGVVNSVNEIAKITGWLRTQGVNTDSIDAEKVQTLLKDLPSNSVAWQVLNIRSILGSASVKKLKTIRAQLGSDGRLHELFRYYGARTGRYSGSGVQAHNLPGSGPEVQQCGFCKKHYAASISPCPWCGKNNGKKVDWSIDAAEDALTVISYKKLEYVERVFGDAISTVSGCLRALFCAAPGHELISADYSAIEAVVLAALAGEEWRLDVFRTHGKIYEVSASKITGIPFEEFIRYKKETGQHHPMRKKIGKPAELGSGFGGGEGAWCAFDADKFLTLEEIRAGVKAWRAASPNIVAYWYGLQDAAINAITYPGQAFCYRDSTYWVYNDVLCCKLISGRVLYYHQPRLHKSLTDWGKVRVNISYMGWNTNPKMGPVGWVRLRTWGGKLTENVVQATARDILCNGLLNLDAAGYPIILHVHDEVIAEVKEGWGSLEEFVSLLIKLPEWCADWPIKAAGWRGKRFRKD